MGNRAVITTREDWKCGGIGIYLHWNGGRDSVNAFLKYCELKGYRPPEKDCYGWASLAKVISNFFGGGNSVGIDTLWHLDCDNYDNGVYIIEDWEIVDRVYFNGREQDEYDLNDMLMAIDTAQNETDRIGSEFFTAEVVSRDRLKIGDKVFVQKWDGTYEKATVVGFGEDRVVNGTHVKDLPWVDLYKELGEDNINSYLQGEAYRVCK